MADMNRTLDEGQAWLLERLERRAHPLDLIDAERARAAVEGLTGLDPESWTATWRALAEAFADEAQAAGDPAAEREAWMQAYQAAFLGRYPIPNHPLKEREYQRARECFLKA